MTRRSDLFARLSLDYADHPKIAVLSDAAFRTHIEMILYSRRYMTDGAIAKQIAKRWPEHCLKELLSNDQNTPSLQLNDDGSYQLHGFDEMQETRSEIEHKRRIRAEAGRKGGLKSSKQNAKQTLSKTRSKIQPETETETETEKRVKRASPKVPIPDDWQPIDSHRAKARELSLDTHMEAEKFKTFHQSKDNRYADWNKAFHTWLTRAAEYGSRPPAQRQTAAEREMQIAAERHQRIESGQLHIGQRPDDHQLWGSQTPQIER